LEREEAVVRQHRRVGVPEHAKEAAFVLGKRGRIGLLVDIDRVWRDHTQ
jgi:hypothetical protein